MRTIRVGRFGWLLLVLMVGCAGGAETPTPQPASDAPPVVLPEPTAGPTVEAPPTQQSGQPVGAASSGDILFVRQGQIWAIGPDGSNERPLTSNPPDSVLDDLALSPHGFYLVFTTNSQTLSYLDLQAGAVMPVDTVALGDVGSPVWMPDGSAVYYQKLTLEPTTSLPARNAIMLSAIPTEGGPGVVVESDLAANPAILVPRFALMTQLIVQDVNFAGNGPSPWFLLDVPTQGLTPLASGFSLADVSSDGLRALLLGSPNGAGAAPLYLADLISTGIGSPAQVSPAGESASYAMPQFSPDGSAIAAIRRDLTANDQPASLVLFAPDGGGGYTMSLLPPPPGLNLIGFVWQNPGSLVVEGIPAGGAAAELWLVPTAAGGAATRLTSGEFPLVVP